MLILNVPRRVLEHIFAVILAMLIVGLPIAGDTRPLDTAEIDASSPPYFARGDGISDDWWPIQSAMLAAGSAGGGVVRVPASIKFYRLGQSLRAVSNVTVRFAPGAKLRCTGDGGGGFLGGRDPTGANVRTLGHWPTYGCVMFGSYDSLQIEELIKAIPPYAILSTRRGEKSITLLKSDVSSDFVPGDVIALDTPENYLIGSGSRAYRVPRARQLNVVEKVDRQRLLLRHPLQLDQQNLIVLRLTNGSGRHGWPTMRDGESGEDTNIPLWATHDARFLGGSWDADGDHPFSAGSGAIDGEIAIERLQGSLVGVGYGNMLAHCHFAVKSEIIGKISLVELSQGSHDNTVQIGEAVSDAHSRVLGLNESARRNVIHIGSIYIAKERPTDVVQIWNASQNEVYIGSVEGSAISGALVSIRPFKLQNAPKAVNNNVHIMRSALSEQASFATIASDWTDGSVVKLNVVSGRTLDDPVISPDGFVTIDRANSP